MQFCNVTCCVGVLVARSARISCAACARRLTPTMSAAATTMAWRTWPASAVSATATSPQARAAAPLPQFAAVAGAPLNATQV